MKTALLELIQSIDNEELLQTIMDLLQDPSEERLLAFMKSLESN